MLFIVRTSAASRRQVSPVARLIFSKVRFLALSWAFLGFVALCGSLWHISRGFAVKGVTLYPGTLASPLRCSLVVSRWSVSCSGFPKHSTAFRFHSLPAPALAVLHLLCRTVCPYNCTQCPFWRFSGFLGFFFGLALKLSALPLVAVCRGC